MRRLTRDILWAGAALIAGVVPASAQQAAPPPLTLEAAEQQALAGHPLVRAAEDQAAAAAAGTREVKSAYYPSVVASLTGAGALNNSRLAAGGLNNPVIFDRYANGVTVGQLITDFGRTGQLSASADLHQQARQSAVGTARQNVQLRVDEAYYEALRAQAVLRVATETVRARQLVVDQASALATNGLRSDLDVSFANVDLSRARLLLAQSQNDVQAAFADLSAAMGSPDSRTYTLVEPGPPAAPPALDDLLASALKNRPDLVAERLDVESARRFESAQGALWRPTVSFVGSAGVTPFRQDVLSDRYGAAGVNVSVPVFNGHLFGALRSEAAARADAEAARLQDEETTATHDVRIAWLRASTGFERLALTDQLLAQALQAQQLAQARYDNGVGTIVELSQAQLNATEAQITQASARYEYAAALAFLRFTAGG